MKLKDYMKRQLFILLTLLTLISCSNNDGQQPLRVGHISWPGYEALSLASAKDLYKNINVKIERPSNNAEILLALEHDIIDVAAVSLNEAVELQSHLKGKIVIIAVLDVSHGGDVIIAQKGIKEVSGLKNMRLGMEPSSFGAYFVSRAIDLYPDLKLNQIKIIPLTIDQHYDQFIADKIDAVATYEPIKSKILKHKGHVIFDSTRIPNEIFDVLITKTSFAEREENRLTELLNGYFKAVTIIKSKSGNVLSSIAEKEGISITDFKKSLSGIHIPDRAENIKLLTETNSSIQVATDSMQVFLKNKNIIKQDASVLPGITNRFLLK